MSTIAQNSLYLKKDFSSGNEKKYLNIVYNYTSLVLMTKVLKNKICKQILPKN